MLRKYFDTLFWFYTCPGKFTSARKTKHFIGLFMTAVDGIKCQYAHSGMTSGVGAFQNPGSNADIVISILECRQGT